MKCQKARELISPYIDGKLYAEESRDFEEHISECHECLYHSFMTIKTVLFTRSIRRSFSPVNMLTSLN